MTADGATEPPGEAALGAMVANEYEALAALLEAAPPSVWDAPSLCEGWRTRQVVAHVTMPARYDGPAFMAELEAAGGDFTTLSDRIATRDGALTHCVIHALDVTEAVPLRRRVPDECIRRVLDLVASGRLRPPGRLSGTAAPRFSRS